jgi:hypothetical protein
MVLFPAAIRAAAAKAAAAKAAAAKAAALPPPQPKACPTTVAQWRRDGDMFRERSRMATEELRTLRVEEAAMAARSSQISAIEAEWKKSTKRRRLTYKQSPPVAYFTG